MKKHIYTEVAISAPPAAVWSILTDTHRYAEWNPFIKRLDGRLEPGARLEAAVELDPDRTVAFRPSLIRVLEGREIRWIGRTGIAGLLDGEHSLSVEPDGDRRSRLVHEEILSGILVPFLCLYLKPRLERGFTAMNAALKQRVENQTSNGRMNLTHAK